MLRLIIRVLSFSAKAVLVLGVCGAIGYPGAAARILSRAMPDAEQEQPAEKNPDAEFLSLLDSAADEMGVPRVLAHASMAQESRGRREAIKFEAGQLAEGRAAAKKAGVAKYELEDQARQYASSHCRLQVMGYNAPKYGLTWLDLYDDANCARVAMAEKAACLNAAKRAYKSNREILRGTERCYNAGQVNDQKGQQHALEVEEKMINELLGKVL